MGVQSVALKDIHDNPFRDPNAYVYDEPKINALMESIGDTSFWENLLARKTKEGRIELAYGHHRKQALDKLVEEGLTEYATIKINVRPDSQLTNERMLNHRFEVNGGLLRHDCAGLLKDFFVNKRA